MMGPCTSGDISRLKQQRDQLLGGATPKIHYGHVNIIIYHHTTINISKSDMNLMNSQER